MTEAEEIHKQLISNKDFQVIAIEDRSRLNRINSICWFYYISATIIFEAKEYNVFIFKARKGIKKDIQEKESIPHNIKLLSLIND